MAMELRRVPAGANEHAHRGAQNFVRLLNGPKVLAAVNNFAFTLDPDDGVTICVPFHLIEGFYARLVENAADVATADIQFCHSRLDIDILLAAEASLSSDFGTSPCSLDEFVRRVEVEAARPDRTAVLHMHVTMSRWSPSCLARIWTAYGQVILGLPRWLIAAAGWHHMRIWRSWSGLARCASRVF